MRGHARGLERGLELRLGEGMWIRPGYGLGLGLELEVGLRLGQGREMDTAYEISDCDTCALPISDWDRGGRWYRGCVCGSLPGPDRSTKRGVMEDRWLDKDREGMEPQG